MDEFDVESFTREDIFKLVDATLAKKEKLDPESRRWLEMDHRSFIKNGLGIPAGPNRDRFKEIMKELSEVRTAFEQTFNKENGGLWFTREELEGVPNDVISTPKKGERENKGKL